MILALAVQLVQQVAAQGVTLGLGVADQLEVHYEYLPGWVRVREAYNQPRYAPC